MNLQEELARIERKAQENKERLQKEYAILSLIGPEVEGYETPHIHPYKLYGARGSIHFEAPFSSTLAKGKPPDVELFRFLLGKFSPVARVQVKDGCTSFRPNVNAPGFDRYNRSQLKSGLLDWTGELLDVCPVTVYIETSDATASFEWYATFDGELWEFKVKFPLYQTDLGRLEVSYDYHDRWHNPEFRTVQRCDFYPSHGAQRCRWASGGNKYPNNFTLWWDLDSGKALDFPALAIKQAVRS